MGYEVKLIIGHASFPTPECERETVGKIDGDYVWFPYKKDAKDAYIHTGRTEFVFLTVATLDLCKCAYGAFGDLVSKNEKESKADTKNVYKWFRDGNTLDETDCYGAKKNPVPLKDVIKAIERTVKEEGDEYRRWKWALALLKQMEKSDPKEFSVILYGH